MALAPYVDSQQTGITGLPTGDGQQVALNSDNWGNNKDSQVGGMYMEWVRRGWVFTAKATASVIFDNLSTLATVPVLWNRLSQNKIVVPMFLRANWTPGTVANTGDYGCVALGALSNAGDAINAAYITAAPNNIGTSNIVNRPIYTPTAIFAPLAILASASVAYSGPFYNTGVGYTVPGTVGGAAAFLAPISVNFQGEVQIAPGGAIAFGLDTAQATAAIFTSLYVTWAELPMFA